MSIGELEMGSRMRSYVNNFSYFIYINAISMVVIINLKQVIYFV
jgi:hypothetical protein